MAGSYISCLGGPCLSHTKDGHGRRSTYEVYPWKTTLNLGAREKGTIKWPDTRDYCPTRGSGSEVARGGRSDECCWSAIPCWHGFSRSKRLPRFQLARRPRLLRTGGPHSHASPASRPKKSGRIPPQPPDPAPHPPRQVPPSPSPRPQPPGPQPHHAKNSSRSSSWK